MGVVCQHFLDSWKTLGDTRHDVVDKEMKVTLERIKGSGRALHAGAMLGFVPCPLNVISLLVRNLLLRGNEWYNSTVTDVSVTTFQKHLACIFSLIFNTNFIINNNFTC